MVLVQGHHGGARNQRRSVGARRAVHHNFRWFVNNCTAVGSISICSASVIIIVVGVGSSSIQQGRLPKGRRIRPVVPHHVVPDNVHAAHATVLANVVAIRQMRRQLPQVLVAPRLVGRQDCRKTVVETVHDGRKIALKYSQGSSSSTGNFVGDARGSAWTWSRAARIQAHGVGSGGASFFGAAAAAAVDMMDDWTVL